jgi:uncharacterized protein (DUF2267 family)
MRERLAAITRRMSVGNADRLAGQLAVLINGAFVSSELLAPDEATDLLQNAVHALVNAARTKV